MLWERTITGGAAAEATWHTELIAIGARASSRVVVFDKAGLDTINNARWISQTATRCILT